MSLFDGSPHEPQPRLSLVWRGVEIRRQPPIVGDFCNVPATREVPWECPVDSCGAGGPNCGRCGYTYCENHFPGHVRPLLVPPDAFHTFLKRLKAATSKAVKGARGNDHEDSNKILRRRFEAPRPVKDAGFRSDEMNWNGVLVQRKPAVVGHYCSVPRRSRADKPCGYVSRNCDGPTEACGHCGFRFCARHAPTHRQGFLVPGETWRSFHRGLEQALDRAASNPHRKSQFRIGWVTVLNQRQLEKRRNRAQGSP